MAQNSTRLKIANGDLEFPDVLRGKRILLATESFGPVNGVSRTTLNLVNYLRGNGVNVAVVAPAISVGQQPRVTSTIDSNGQVEVRLRGYPLPYNPELSVVYPVRLSALYSRTFGSRPDLIYLVSDLRNISDAESLTADSPLAGQSSKSRLPDLAPAAATTEILTSPSSLELPNRPIRLLRDPIPFSSGPLGRLGLPPSSRLPIPPPLGADRVLPLQLRAKIPV